MESTIEPSEKLPRISVMVPTHNRLDLTMRCIKAIYDHTKVPFDLIVVDDSTDLTPTYFADLQKQHDNIKFIHSDEPYKCGNQLFNIALANTTTEYMATVMNSVTVEPDWEVVALGFMEDHPKIGVIGFKCLLPWGQIETAGIQMNGFRPCDIGRDLAGHRLSTVYECEAVQWAFALLRKEAIGVLEEDAYHGFRGWDDIDNCFVARKNGWHVFYCGLGVGYHEPRATRGSNDIGMQKLNHENALTFYKRWGYWDAYKKMHPLEPGVGVIGRNEKCVCGSGKKFKHCCGRNQ